MFRIGDFSRLARVTVKTLRHYDEEDLLRPAHVDSESGYRYYDAAQLEHVQRIVLLKDLGFGLGEIRALLKEELGERELASRLDERRATLTATIAADQSRLRRLDAWRLSLAEAGWAHAASVTLREVPAVDVHSVRARVPTFGTHVQAMFEAAEAAVGAIGARADESPLLLFHDSEYREQDADVEVCIPVTTDAAGRLAVRTLPAVASMGCVTYQGPYDRTPFLYDVMLRWMGRSGMRIDGPLREVYHRYGADERGYRLPSHVLAARSADYVTELQAPVAEIT